MLKKDQAICIRTVDYSETSQVVTMFCRQSGKVGLMAKGTRRARSSLGGTIELFSHGQVVFSEHAEGKLSTLTEFDRQGDFTLLRRRLILLNAALFGAELVNLLMTDKDPHSDVFDDFMTFLGDLQQARTDTSALQLLILFQVGLLGRLGLGLVLGRCANCSTEYGAGWPAAFFSSTAHGILCRDCEGSFADRLQLSREAGACLGQPRSVVSASDRTLAEVEKTIIFHLTAILHHPPRMASQFLQKSHGP
jgi:DNA repair protein RecO (recombination protein O)